ncbi:MAG: hypothetical protein NTW29_03180 [Bacteroidetes bacterium]|nr:hypothetical protein [Bacteroidota bacterium]
MDDTTTQEYKIKKYHADEIRLILFLSATDLTNYESDELVGFVEFLVERSEVLLTTDFLHSIRCFISIDSASVHELLELRDMLQILSTNEWLSKVKDTSWDVVIKQARKIMGMLNMEYQEPLAFMESHFDVNW